MVSAMRECDQADQRAQTFFADPANKSQLNSPTAHALILLAELKCSEARVALVGIHEPARLASLIIHTKPVLTIHQLKFFAFAWADAHTREWTDAEDIFTGGSTPELAKDFNKQYQDATNTALAVATGLALVETTLQTPSSQKPQPTAQAHLKYPAASYYHLPASVAGKPAFYGGEGGVCDKSNDYCKKTDTVGNYKCGRAGAPEVHCQSYQYGVAANVRTQHNRPYSKYEVAIYPSSVTAQQANSDGRVGAARDDGGHPIPRIAIAQPLNQEEWLYGKALDGAATDCIMSGGVRYQNVVLFAYVTDQGSITPPGAKTCELESRWVLRVLSALYARTVHLH